MNTSLLPRYRDSFGVVVATIFAIAILAGCSGKTSSEITPESQPNPAPTNSLMESKNMAEFRRKLKLGMSTNDILAVLGQPDRVSDILESQILWDFTVPPFPVDDSMPRKRVVGINLSITNGRLAHYGFAIETRTQRTLLETQPVKMSFEGPTLKIEFFVVNDEPIDGGRYIDTTNLPKLGYVAAAADLTIERFKEITLIEQLETDLKNNQRTNWNFDVTLYEESVSLLKAVTETNVGRRFLIVVEREPILAPLLTSTLERTQIAISVEDRKTMENLKRIFERMPLHER